MADEDAMKQAVIDLAREQARNGAHYLWGCAGNTPGESDGATYRPSHARLHENIPGLDGTAPKKMDVVAPILFAAWVDSSDQGKLACAGRCAIAEVQALPLALTITVKDALAIKVKSLTTAQLDEFKKNRGDSDSFRWPRPNGTLTAGGHHSAVWGESCIGVRHFDCIGLVNYCMSDVLGRVWHYGIENFTRPATGKASGFLEVKGIGAAEPCDIVTVGSEHIGIVSERRTVIEAMDGGHGVLERDISVGHWSQIWRLPKSTWK
jgi:hypothetical protein